MKILAVAAALAAIIPVPGDASPWPALAGSHVLWTRQAERPEVYVDTRLAWRAPIVPVPPGAAGTSFDASVSQTVGSIAASTSTAAFVHTADLILTAKCRKVVPPCMIPDLSVRIRGEVWAGPASGPFRRIAGGENRPIVLAADASGVDLIYSEGARGGVGGIRTPSRVVLVRPGRRPLALASSRAAVFDGVALAGSYAAWLERPTGTRRYPQDLFTLTVYDVRRGRVAYRLGQRALETNNAPPFDLEADGAVAFVSDRAPRGGCDGGVGWASPRAPRPHFLAGNALQAAIRIAAGRIVFASRPSCAVGGGLRLTVADLAGRTRAIASLASVGGFDFDGRRVAYVANGGIQVIPVR